MVVLGVLMAGTVEIFVEEAADREREVVASFDVVPEAEEETRVEDLEVVEDAEDLEVVIEVRVVEVDSFGVV